MSFCHSLAVAKIVVEYIKITMQYSLCTKVIAALHNEQTLEGLTAKIQFKHLKKRVLYNLHDTFVQLVVSISLQIVCSKPAEIHHISFPRWPFTE